MMPKSQKRGPSKYYGNNLKKLNFIYFIFIYVPEYVQPKGKGQLNLRTNDKHSNK